MDGARFDKQRNELFASLLKHDYAAFERRYKAVFQQIKHKTSLKEADQKALNQIRRIVRRFRHPISTHGGDELKPINRQFQQSLARIVRNETGHAARITYDQWKADLNLPDDRLEHLLNTVTILQISTGCSHVCRRCNEWALPGVRRHFSFDAVIALTTDIVKTGNRRFIYYAASDPLDWHDGDKHFADIAARLIDDGIQPEYGILTKIPKGKEKVIQRLLDLNADMAVSITKKNAARIKEIEKKTGKRLSAHHEVDELLIPAGSDEDFKTVKSSITDHYGGEITPDGAFMVIPTFTSALHPTGQSKIPVDEKTDFFLKGITGRDALKVEYFKPLQAVHTRNGTFTLKKLLDPQVETILLDTGETEAVPPGMIGFPEYCSIYTAEAIHKRKQLIPAVEKTQKKKLDDRISAGMPFDEAQNRFDRRMAQYIRFCDWAKVIEYKKKAFSFFLHHIACYLKHHAAEREIIRYLIKNQKKSHHHRPVPDFSDPDRLLEKSRYHPFGLFRAAVSRLLISPHDDTIARFIDKHPAQYDRESDRFVEKGG